MSLLRLLHRIDDVFITARGEWMEFTIREVSQRFNLSSSTLRYYDKEGLFPFMQKKASGYRTFSEKDLACLELVQCLKSTGLSIKEIKQFFDLAVQGEGTVPERLRLFEARRDFVMKQISQLQDHLRVINAQCEFYRTWQTKGREAAIRLNGKKLL